MTTPITASIFSFLKFDYFNVNTIVDDYILRPISMDNMAIANAIRIRAKNSRSTAFNPPPLTPACKYNENRTRDVHLAAGRRCKSPLVSAIHFSTVRKASDSSKSMWTAYEIETLFLPQSETCADLFRDTAVIRGGSRNFLRGGRTIIDIYVDQLYWSSNFLSNISSKLNLYSYKMKIIIQICLLFHLYPKM